VERVESIHKRLRVCGAEIVSLAWPTYNSHYGIPFGGNPIAREVSEFKARCDSSRGEAALIENAPAEVMF
jgi:hypothetical protein